MEIQEITFINDRRYLYPGEMLVIKYEDEKKAVSTNGVILDMVAKRHCRLDVSTDIAIIYRWRSNQY